jgi:xanthine dehydrogenase accessory factor
MSYDKERQGSLTSGIVVVRGGGDLGSGVAHRLSVARFAVVILELPLPLVIRRSVAFASAIFEGEIRVEGITARRTSGVDTARALIGQGIIPVLVDPTGSYLSALSPTAIIDARLAKRNLGTKITDAPVVIGLGPGFSAGVDCHAVIETERGHNLGKVIWQGAAAPNSGVPGSVGGEDMRRLVRSPAAGTFHAARRIGEIVQAGDAVGTVGDLPATALTGGVLRGIIHEGTPVTAGMKIGDIDPRGAVEHCFTISDKARAIGGGVLEALLRLGVMPGQEVRRAGF